MSLGVRTVLVHNAKQTDVDGVYTGRLVNNKRDGRGKLTWIDEDGQHAYDGHWCDGKMHGRGQRTWPDGGAYDGEWQNGCEDGWGARHHPDGGRYEGLWRRGRWARGAWHDQNGVDVKEGEWVWDDAGKTFKQQGWGLWRKKMVKGDDDGRRKAAQGATTTATTEVTVYDGEWNNDQRHGNGMWRSPDTGTIYCGEWDHDEISGTGRMLIGDHSTRHNDPGGSYVGGMKDGEFHGEGVRVWSNGDRYQGNWENDKEHGNGTKRWARDGSSFTGVWERGTPVNGTMEWPNGDMFTGTFTEEVAEQQRGGEMRRYSGEGDLSLSLQSTDRLLAGGESNKLKGSLRGNTFHGADGVALHVMGSSLLQWGHSQLIKELHTKQIEEEEGDSLLAVHSALTETPQQQGPSEALSELSTAFKMATKYRSQLKKAAPLLVSLEESLSGLKQLLESSTERNQALKVHVRDLSNLKEALEKAVKESDKRCQDILGKKLTVESSESEIQQCSRNISSLMKKLLGIKPSSSANNEEEQRGAIAIPSQDINNVMTLKPWSLLKSLEPPPHSSPTALSLMLREITDTVLPTQGACNSFARCLNVVDQHTVLHKECNNQAALGQRLHEEIQELLNSCQGLNESYSLKYMVMRALEGDEKFMTHPDVWSQLSELLPRAQQSVVDVTLAKCTASSTRGISATTTTMPTKPARTVSVFPSSHVLCVVCEERAQDTQFQPCGDCVCCSECAGIVKRCPHCRSPIQNRINICSSS
ncbi:2-isopropylmalate synthase [Pelomyxa schiedti]|nr:2-isopropylmalate synthase [Pelomyxa schiedti]